MMTQLVEQEFSAELPPLEDVPTVAAARARANELRQISEARRATFDALRDVEFERVEGVSVQQFLAQLAPWHPVRQAQQAFEEAEFHYQAAEEDYMSIRAVAKAELQARVNARARRILDEEIRPGLEQVTDGVATFERLQAWAVTACGCELKGNTGGGGLGREFSVAKLRALPSEWAREIFGDAG
jgi:hypothetical protein